MNHVELAALWNSAYAAWADDRPLPSELTGWRRCYSGTGTNAVDDQAMAEPWIGDLDSHPTAVTMGIHPGAADPAFQHRGGAWPNTIDELHDGSYSQWAATNPYLGDVWESSHGLNAHTAHRARFLSAWTGTDLSPSQIVDFPVFPWHVADWDSSAFRLDPGVVREFVLEPIASAGASWAFGFGKDWWDLIEQLDLPILDRLGDGGRPYPTQVDHRRWLVAEGPGGLRIAAMRLDSMPIPPKKEETEDLRRVLESGPAGDDRRRAMSPALEADLAARLRELDVSYMHINRLMHAIDDVELVIDAWQVDESGKGVDLMARDQVVVTVMPEWADFSTEAPTGSSIAPDTEGVHRLPLPRAATTPPKAARREPKPLGMCPECFNVLNPDGSCPMECEAS